LPLGYKGELSGQGGAFRQVGPTRIAVFSVVNALGAIVDRQGKVVVGNLDPDTGDRVAYMDGLDRQLGHERGEAVQGGNTTLTVVVTNQRLSPARGTAWALRQFARLVHTSMARAIQPFHTPFDGDVLYAVTTNEVENPNIDDIVLGALASELAWDAVLSVVE
jgi:L-aminopeptidase/D-esterase-like protein